MTASPFDSLMLREHLSDPQAARLFTDGAEIRAMLLAEGALAKAQGELGLIPQTAARAIHRAAREVAIDPAGLAAGAAASGVVVPAFVEAFRAAMGAPEHAAFVHHGATSQDILDTALVLRLRPYLELCDARLAAILGHLADGAERWAQTPMAARTRGQIATPTTLGARLAAWGAPLIRARERLAQLRPRVLVLSLAGASGNSAALGPRAPEVARAMAAELDLHCPEIPWHAGRDGLAELAAALAIQTASLGKIGLDLALLSQSEVGELRAGEGGGSSTMPHKANPVGAEALVSLARYASRLSGAAQEAMLAGHERDGAAWTLEWLSLPQLCLAAAAALRHAEALTGDLRPDPERMRANMDATHGLMMAEAASFRLAETLPRPQAQALVKAACAEAVERRRPLAEVLSGLPEGAGIDWQAALDPAAHVGEAPAIARRFAAMVRKAG
ncbi:lyase family protein [Albimonas pacifica]|uniref:3-carboxy-cis,cis-muconate cycloisomerase n=1 Tax=Albimonas pacifica TaxID=1114924 RepID=A0A1I3D1M3_9RHOB|nr:lyase family protein [Albimonas pacifica]SFH80603.1 3-carboxy-cis,cis-muconate cycloisomerase [Albimonas pacifica]